MFFEYVNSKRNFKTGNPSLLLHVYSFPFPVKGYRQFPSRAPTSEGENRALVSRQKSNPISPVSRQKLNRTFPFSFPFQQRDLDWEETMAGPQFPATSKPISKMGAKLFDGTRTSGDCNFWLKNIFFINSYFFIK